MRTPIANRDPGDEQTSIFDSPAVCPHCHTTRRNLCAHNADIAHGTLKPLARRPKGCIASAQLGPNDPLPEGF